MHFTSIDGGQGAVLQGPQADALVAECLAAFSGGSLDAIYDLGVAFSTASHGVTCDLVEAHRAGTRKPRSAAPTFPRK